MGMTLERHVYNAMLTAARKAAPLEACGLLGGRASRITEFYELGNIDASNVHYSMAPEEQFAAVKDMRRKGVFTLAIWHSHPATPARMSDEDIRLAYTPDAVYIILSLATPGRPELRGFLVENGQATETGLRVSDRSAIPVPTHRQPVLWSAAT